MEGAVNLTLNIIKNESIGELIQYSEDSLNNALSQLISKRNEWQSMSINAKRLYHDVYSWNIMQQRLKTVYDSLNL